MCPVIKFAAISTVTFQTEIMEDEPNRLAYVLPGTNVNIKRTDGKFSNKNLIDLIKIQTNMHSTHQ